VNETEKAKISMSILLDTHILIWSMVEPDRLSRRARLVIENPRVVYSFPPRLPGNWLSRLKLENFLLPL
jgi:hypothetical protein